MKKFFALALALVMALSLTTVAWGADITVGDSASGATYDNLADAIAAAADGDTIILKSNIEVPALAKIDKDITVDLNGFTLSRVGGTAVYVKGTAPDVAEVTIKNGTVTSNDTPVYVDANAAVELVDVDVTCTVDPAMNQNAVYVRNGGSVAISGGVITAPSIGVVSIGNGTKNTVVISGAEITADFGVFHNGSAYGVDVTISNNTVINGTTVGVYLSGNSTAFSGAVNKLSITDSSITGETAVEVKQTDVTVSGASVLTATGAVSVTDNGDGTCTTGYALALTNSGSDTTVGDVTIEGGTFVGEVGIKDDSADSDMEIAAGTFSVLPDESYLADGVTFIGNTVGVLDKKATTYDNLYAKSTDMAATDPTTEVDIVVTPAKAAKYDKTTGEIEDMGNVEYVCITGDGTYYVFVKTLADADVVLYKDAAGKQVKFYLAEVETPYYFEGAAFNSFGEKCGQVDYDDYDKTLKYFTIKGFDAFILVEEAEEFACDVYVLYNGKMIPVVVLGLDKVPHTAIYTSKNGVVESIECGACGLKAAKVPNALSMPKDADVVTGETLWYWPSAAGTTGTTTGSTVQSAQTFDAGIAMYVGMSVMAAAGSAVVIGKKKD